MKTQRSRKAENQGKAGRQRSRVEKLRIRNKNQKKRKKQTLKNIVLHTMWQTYCYKPTTSMVFTTHLWIFRLILWIVDQRATRHSSTRDFFRDISKTKL